MTEEVIQPDWVRNAEETLQGVEEGVKESEAIAHPDFREYSMASYSLAKQKYAGELDAYKKALESGYVVVESMLNLPFTESAGLYWSRFFTTIRDEGKLLANRCPKCRRVIFPPRIVCGFCKSRIEDKDGNWIQLSDKGTVTSINITTDREVDRAIGKVIGEARPCIYIRLDGGDNWTIITHYSEEMDIKKLHTGMRVQAVWKPREERQARMTDIKYFRIIEE